MTKNKIRKTCFFCSEEMIIKEFKEHCLWGFHDALILTIQYWILECNVCKSCCTVSRNVFSGDNPRGLYWEESKN